MSICRGGVTTAGFNSHMLLQVQWLRTHMRQNKPQHGGAAAPESPGEETLLEVSQDAALSAAEHL